MPKEKYILSVDQGTTGTRVILFNHDGEVCHSAYMEIKQYYPKPGWVEHNPIEILNSVTECIKVVMEKSNILQDQILAIGITNQRETTILWDRDSGKPLYNAIVWQCRRSAPTCDDLKSLGLEKLIRNKTGLFIDPYFSSTKIKWLVDNVSTIKQKINKGRVCFGNVDSWLIWNFTGGKYHITDYSNASRTMLFNIFDLKWDDELLEILNLNKNILPEVVPSSEELAVTSKNSIFTSEIPITGVAGDQQAALFGQGCFKPGMVKNTYGTALALMMNTGKSPVLSKSGLMTDLAWYINKEAYYALEGLIFIGGATVQWLRDGLGIIDDASETETLANRVSDTGNVYLIPAFSGLSAPYWDMYARGLLIGITRGTTKEHICRAALEAIAYESRDVIEAMVKDSDQKLKSLRVDGGATKNNFLMQFQADILGIPVEKPRVIEMTALGAAYLSGLGVGFWKNLEEIEKHWFLEKRFEPQMNNTARQKLYSKWKEAVKRSFRWAE
jgi:glycerol kinase